MWINTSDCALQYFLQFINIRIGVQSETAIISYMKCKAITQVGVSACNHFCSEGGKSCINIQGANLNNFFVESTSATFKSFNAGH